MEKIAPFVLAATLALPAMASGVAPDTGVDGELRSLAEIDGDPNTFTEDEREKMALLRQVLGTAPVAPQGRLAEAPRVNGTLDAGVPGP